MSAVAEIQGPPNRLAAGALVLTSAMTFDLTKRGYLHEDPRQPGVIKLGAYHASQDTRFRDFTTGGFPTSSRPEADYLPRLDRGKMIARARVMFRNNPYLSAILQAFVMEMGTPTLKSQTSDELYNDAKERGFERWAEDCESDHSFSLDQVIEIYNYERCIAGELFILKRREGWLQLIASELCGSTNRTKTPVNVAGGPQQAFADGTAVPAGATERDGVLRDADNFLIGYRFGTRDDYGVISFVPARSSLVQVQYVYHLYDPDRVEMDRGVALLSPVINPFQDVADTAAARAQQVKNASCLSLWITKNQDPNGYAEAMRGSLRTGDMSNIAALKQAADSRSSHQEIKSGAVYYGATGETLQIIEPKLNAGDFHDHYIDLLGVCCRCLRGMPVEVGIEGFRDSSYSSSRATMNPWKRNVRRDRRRLETKFLQPLQLWQSRRAQIFGDLDDPPASQPGSVTHNTDEDVRFGWPAIPDIDEAKTSARNAIDLANGTTTRTSIYADRGEYIDVEDKIFAKEKGAMLKLLIKEGTGAGLDPSTAQAWALSQMPASDPRAVTALVPLLAMDPGSPPPKRD